MKTGFGMRLVDGVDWLMLGGTGFLALIICALVGVLWANRKGDVQGASGITQCLMAYVMFLVAMVGVSGIR